MKGLNVLSLFDGMSCGQIALKRAGINVYKYHASEVDKYAIKVTQKNHPDTIQLGSIIDLKEEDLYNLGKIDLLIGGSPCQGFSFAGKQKGSVTKCGVDVTTLNQYLKLKKEGFEFNGQSYLFWEYVRVWKIVKPKYFLLENVRITKKWQEMFDTAMGVKPIVINSALVSAQNRVRYYWTNIKDISLPIDKGVLLKDIVLNGLPAFGCAIRGRYLPNGKTEQRLEFNGKEKSNALTTVYKDSLCCQVGNANIKGNESIKRVYSINGKSPTLTTMTGGLRWPKIALKNLVWRKLEPIECERLQTVPDNYTDCVSNSQRYKMLGNGWTVDVIAHIFKSLK
tara:strand:- start:147 stop:1160 length:1014 start_codon:yes stop_codon:yes gene_type:complete